MNEWGVVGVIAALVSLIIGIGAPVIKLNTSIARLTSTIENIERRQLEDKEQNSRSHDRIWVELDRHDNALTEHDRRILKIETKNRKDAQC